MRSEKNKNSKSLLYKMVLMMIIILVLLVSVGVGFAVSLAKTIPTMDSTGLDSYAMTSYVYDNKGVLLAELHGEENRIPVKLEDISPHMKKAIIAIEDQRFYEHKGVDLYRIAGAFVANVKSKRIVQGGSTITQQLVGMSKLDRSEKTLKRKLQEALIAIKVEREYSKDDILEIYLNRVYFGYGAYGIEAAAQTFFNKHAKELNVQESALLAGIIQNPYMHSPIIHPDAAKSRREVVFNAMVEAQEITPEEADTLKKTEILLSEESINKVAIYDHQSFTDHVIAEALEKLELENDSERLFQGGYRIYTSLDTRIQEKMEEVYGDSTNFPEGEGDEIIQSAMVVLDHRTGEIKGIVGGREQEGDSKRVFNRATQSYRQPGSAFKPIVVFGPALEKGYSPASVLDDYPQAYSINREVWAPRNYDNRYRGLVSMRTAAKYSINVWSVKMLNQIGIEEGFRFAESLGISTLVSKGKYHDKGLALALGGLTKGVSPLEMAGAYGAFANEGIYLEPYVVTRILDQDGKVIWEHDDNPKPVMGQETAYLVTSMLQTGVEEGTGRRAQLDDRPVAGKTGTSTDTKDAWFIGYTSELVGAVWLGYDNPKEMTDVIGGGYNAGPIWKQVMEVAHQDIMPRDFSRPPGIMEVPVDKKSGLLVGESTPFEAMEIELFNRNNVPKEVSSAWVKGVICAESRQLLTAECPSSVTKYFLKREIPWSAQDLPRKFRNAVPEDANLELPSQYCTIHGEPESLEVDNADEDNQEEESIEEDNTEEDNTEQSNPEEDNPEENDIEEDNAEEDNSEESADIIPTINGLL